MMKFDFIQGDVFEIDLPVRSFGLVYADPPYANCRFKYARRNGSRQWGKDRRQDFMRELIAVMERFRSEDGVCAVSMTSREALYLGHLFPSDSRQLAWVKPFAPHRPHVWPTYAWEPVVAWGKFPGREEQKASQTPHDWLNFSPKIPEKGGHETPKPGGFAQWLLNVTLGPRPTTVLELFAGTAPVAREAALQGLKATAVDLDNWLPKQMDLVEAAD